ncbi:MAG: cytochrome bc1 complex diheme cytochrome c subunit [Acidimicrobiales bacterium]
MLARLFRHRMVLPAALVAGVGVAGALSFAVGAGAQGSPSPVQTTTTTTAPGSSATSTTTGGANANTVAGNAQVGKPTGGTRAANGSNRRTCKEPTYGFGPTDSGTPRSTIRRCSGGQLVAYGDHAIMYRLPSQANGQPPSERYLAAGESLFEQNCSSCHGPAAAGSAAAPNLVGLGPATVEFWITTGLMPAQTPLTVQAPTKPPRLTDAQAAEVAAWINSLDPAAPYVPKVNLKGANLADGASLFALNCAACHTITGAGDALAYGTFAPSLHKVTPTQIASAIRTGPINMPVFSGNLSDSQVRDIVAYVSEKIQHPTNNGGFGLGGVGPVAEGFVALLVGVGGLILVCFWIGERA